MKTNVTPEIPKGEGEDALGGQGNSEPAERPTTVPGDRKVLQSLPEMTWAAICSGTSSIKDLIVHGYSGSLITYGVYMIRSAGLVTGVLSVFAPVIESGLLGVIGWCVDLLLNLAAGFACFIVAEVVLVQRETAETVRNLANQGQSEYATKDQESMTDGY